MQNFTKEQIQTARKADLYDYLVYNHPTEVMKDYDSLRLRNNHSVSVKKGFYGFYDFATGEKGNPVDFLTHYMGYDTVDAVLALNEFSDSETDYDTSDIENYLSSGKEELLFGKTTLDIPEPAEGNYSRLYAYLCSRGIDARLISSLIRLKLLYQEKRFGNIVFLNKEHDWAELRGTYSNKPFHGILRNSRNDGFWWFRNSKDAKDAYICESSIDAISLYQLHAEKKMNEQAYYIGIAGAMKQAAIDRIRSSDLHVILAVDNDEAGQTCRDRNADLDFILPESKDWNTDLINKQVNAQPL